LCEQPGPAFIYIKLWRIAVTSILLSRYAGCGELFFEDIDKRKNVPRDTARGRPTRVGASLRWASTQINEKAGILWSDQTENLKEWSKDKDMPLTVKHAADLSSPKRLNQYYCI
jgi:hypothetical protein